MAETNTGAANHELETRNTKLEYVMAETNSVAANHELETRNTKLETVTR
jgi:hypothetical protein